ncbi:unnamed protein product [Chrysoparadoxa australica]
MSSPYQTYASSPRPSLEMVRKMHNQIGVWFGFFTAAFALYTMFSDGDFSFLMTFAAFTRTFGFALLNVRMFIKKHAKGVSRKTLYLYVVVFGSRLVSILRHEGYLPYDRSGDFVYHIAEITSGLLAVLALFFMHTKFARSYQKDYDSFGNLHLPNEWGLLYLLIPCTVVAVFVHPSLNNDFVSDTAWTLSMYLESCALVPQLYMFQRQAKGIVEVLVSHCVFALGFARVLDMVFWLYSYHELSDASGNKTVGVFVLGTQFVHIAVMGDFFYYYFISLKTGDMMQLPMQASIV